MEPIIVHVDPEIRELIPDFLANRRRDITDMLRALESGDSDTLQRMGHSLKGVGGGFGFDEITSLGEVIEIAAKTRHFEDVRMAALRLRTYLDRVRVVFDAETC